MRCYFWLGDPFEFALLMQSIFLILSMVRATNTARDLVSDDCPARDALYLYPVQASNKSGEPRRKYAPRFLLAMADLRAVY